MNVSPFVIQLAIVIVVVLGVAAWTLRFALRAGEGDAAEPIIRARAKELQDGWYQVEMGISNRAPYGLSGVSLRRVRPRSVRLMAPITSVSTRKGRFQVWSDPNVDDPATSIPIHVEVGPHEGRLGFAAPGAVAHSTARLYLRDGRNVADLTLELSLVDRARNIRRFKFGVAFVRPS